MKRRPGAIYPSKKSVAVTLFFVTLPFLFLLLFSEITKLSISTLFLDISTSVLRMIAAYLISAMLGWLLAISFYSGKRSLVALPIFDVLQSFPAFSALPFAIYVWGSSNLTVIIFLVIAIIWPIFFSIISSLKSIHKDWQEVVKVSNLHGWDYLRKFLWPVSAPGLIIGSIIGLGDGWEALVVTEIIVSVKRGLGSFFQFFSHNPTITAFGIFGFLVLIFSINKLIWLPLLERSHRTMEE